jgi:hypothetical protein
MSVADLRAAVIQIGLDLDQTVNTYTATEAYKQASARFSALMARSNNPLTAYTAEYLANVAQQAFFWEGKPGEVLQRLEEFAATIQ